MKPMQQQRIRSIVLVVFLFFGAGMLLVPDFGDGLHFFHTMMVVPEASASGHYGIRGRKAPELNLEKWIDGNGKQTAPIRLKDLRGKVVYMYFFQDW